MKVAVSRAACLRVCPLGEFPLYKVCLRSEFLLVSFKALLLNRQLSCGTCLQIFKCSELVM